MCLLLDVGTKPTKTSFYHLYRAFESDPNVGGACGEIAAELGSGWRNLLNPLVATQNFEYKMSNILDKPLESVFGYISVLPGAFSAYRYQALEGAPLECYFKGETMHGGSNIFAANMYLVCRQFGGVYKKLHKDLTEPLQAEDRILCFELVTKRGASWLLRYVKSARAETDVPDSLPELISQRRRWLNGSFFAAVHATSHWSYIFRSGHATTRKFWLCIEFLYNAINILFSWFSIANFYLAFHVSLLFRNCCLGGKLTLSHSSCLMLLTDKKEMGRTRRRILFTRTVTPSLLSFDWSTSSLSSLSSSAHLVCTITLKSFLLSMLIHTTFFHRQPPARLSHALLRHCHPLRSHHVPDALHGFLDNLPRHQSG